MLILICVIILIEWNQITVSLVWGSNSSCYLIVSAYTSATNFCFNKIKINLQTNFFIFSRMYNTRKYNIHIKGNRKNILRPKINIHGSIKQLQDHSTRKYTNTCYSNVMQKYFQQLNSRIVYWKTFFKSNRLFYNILLNFLCAVFTKYEDKCIDFERTLKHS